MSSTCSTVVRVDVSVYQRFVNEVIDRQWDYLTGKAKPPPARWSQQMADLLHNEGLETVVPVDQPGSFVMVMSQSDYVLFLLRWSGNVEPN